jgi:hypothetical protein
MTLLRSALLGFLTLLLVVPASAQESDKEVYDRALPQLTRLMGSEEAAIKHLELLWSFSRRAQRPFAALVKLSQREQVAGINEQFYLLAMLYCGEISAALGAKNEEYFAIMLIMFDMKLKNTSAYGGLESLTRRGVPAYRLLAKAIGKDERQTRNIVLSENLKVEMIPDALLAMIKLEYSGSITARSKK